MTKKRKRSRLTSSQLLLVFAGMMFGIVPMLIGFVYWRIRKQRSQVTRTVF